MEIIVAIIIGAIGGGYAAFRYHDQIAALLVKIDRASKDY